LCVRSLSFARLPSMITTNIISFTQHQRLLQGLMITHSYRAKEFKFSATVDASEILHLTIMKHATNSQGCLQPLRLTRVILTDRFDCRCSRRRYVQFLSCTEINAARPRARRKPCLYSARCLVARSSAGVASSTKPEFGRMAVWATGGSSPEPSRVKRRMPPMCWMPSHGRVGGAHYGTHTPMFVRRATDWEST
jgi:hypothetical protein